LFKFASSNFFMTYNDKQLQIISAAELRFSDKGFDGTSVRDIAEAAGVNVAMISYYFGSKEKLMQAIFEQRTQHTTARIEGLLHDDTLTPFEKMEKVIDDFADRVVEKHKFYRLMICDQVIEKNNVIAGLLGDLKKKNADLINKLIADGQQKKIFKENIDVAMLMNTMSGIIMHSFMGKDYYKNYHNLQHLSEEQFFELFKERLKKYVKDIFKSILIYEG